MTTAKLIISLDPSGHGFEVTTATGHTISLPVNSNGARFIYELLLQATANRGATINLPEAPSQAAVHGVMDFWKRNSKSSKANLPLDAVLAIWKEEDRVSSNSLPVKIKRFDERGREVITLEDLLG